MTTVAQDWFRLPDWNAEAREEFERRLARARPHNQPQYLRIKAVALRGAGEHDGAIALLDRILREHSTALDAAFAAELLGDIAREDGRNGDAADWYRRSLDLGTNMTTGTAHISLADVLNRDRDYEGALEALKLVPLARLTLNSARFRWNAVLAESALGVGELDVARDAARRALTFLDAPDQFSRHPGVGRATASKDQRDRLEAISLERVTAPTVARRKWLRRN